VPARRTQAAREHAQVLNWRLTLHIGVAECWQARTNDSAIVEFAAIRRNER
jgi:hypothetical protein